MLKLLSYPLGESTPPYGDNPPVRITHLAEIESGDVANWLELTTINHSGTHIDAPFHFNLEGKRLTDLDINDLRFDAPLLVDLPKHDGELIRADDLQPFADKLKSTDLLLVRTGWAQNYRQQEPGRFGRNAPGFASNAGNFLLDETSVQAVAMDIPSAASPVAGTANDEGLEFHRIVLGTGKAPHERYVLLIEDVKLDPDLSLQGNERIMVVPLWLENADAAPVTMILEAP